MDTFYAVPDWDTELNKHYSDHYSDYYLDGVSRWWEYSRAKFISYKWSRAIKNLQLRIHLVHWKPVLDAHSQRVMDIDISTLPQILYLRLALHNYCQLRKEKIPEKSLALALNFEKRVQPVTSNLSFKRFLNEKKATDIR